MAATIVSNSTAENFKNSPQKTGEPLDHAVMYSGKALEFDGVTDYLDIGSTQTYTLTNNGFTLSCWIYLDSVSVASYLTYGSNNDRINFNSAGNQMLIQIDGKGSTSHTFTPIFNTGKWHYLTVVYKAGIIYIYNNGEAVKFSNDSLTYWDRTGDGLATTYDHRYIGYYVSPNLTAKLSNYQIWNTAWEESDVQYAYRNPERLVTDRGAGDITTSNLKLWYPMNETGDNTEQISIFDGAPVELGSELMSNGTFDGTIIPLSEQDYTAASRTNIIAGSWQMQTAGANGVDHYGQQYGSEQAIEIYSETAPGNYTSLIDINGASVKDGRIYVLTFDAKKLASSTYLKVMTSSGTGITVSPVGGGIDEGITDLTSEYKTYTRHMKATSDDIAYIVFGREGGDSSVHAVVNNVSFKELTGQNHATTTFYGDELFASEVKRKFENVIGDELITNSSAQNFTSEAPWVNSTTGANQWNTYEEDATTGFTSGAYFYSTFSSTNCLKLAVTSDGNTREALLDGYYMGESNMTVGKHYRLSYSIEITAYSSGTFTIGMCNTSNVIDAGSRKQYTGTTGPKADYFEFIYQGTTTHAKINLHASTNSAFTLYLDNFSLKEIGKLRTGSELSSGAATH